MPKSYDVVLPIAGHVQVTVEAESEEQAIEVAMENATINDIQSWEALKQFHAGNVCYCPYPWEASVELSDQDEEEPVNDEES